MSTGRRLTLDDIARRPRPGMDAPGSAVFAPDGRSLTYLHSRDGSLVRSLWRHDLVTGMTRASRHDRTIQTCFSGGMTAFQGSLTSLL